MRGFRVIIPASLLAVALDPACGGTVSNDSSDPERYGGDATGPGGYAGSVTGRGGAAGTHAAVDASAVGSGGVAADAGLDVEVPVDASLLDGGDAQPTADVSLDVGVEAGVDASEDAAPDAGLDAPVDAVLDAPMDAVVDAPVDAVVDAAVDAIADAAPDSEADAQPPVTAGMWAEVAVAGPSPRWGHGLAYDGARGRAVLFGGWPGPSPVIDSETWEWDGVRWELVAPAGAGPRTWIFFGMTYDPVRELTVVHGGYTNTAVDACGTMENSNATWGWDGDEWMLLSCQGPAGRGIALAYDSVRDRVVTVAGGTVRSETWEWDGELWTVRTSDGPSPRHDYALSFDPVRARVVLFGGSAAEPLGDTWEWDGDSWQLMAETGPPPAQKACMSYFAGDLRRTVLLVNGETWQWDGRDWTYVDVVGPSPRENAAMTYDARGRHIVLFGGDALPDNSHDNLGDTWIYGVHHSLE